MQYKKLYFILIFFSFKVIADDANILFKRFNKFKNFYASFKQEVIDYDGNIIQHGKGKIWIKYPNLFRWHLIYPIDNLIFSDGKNLWFYNQLTKQLSIFLIKKIFDKNPLMLIVNHELSELKYYIIKKQNNNFTLIPKKNTDSKYKKFNISITKEGKINNFSIIQKDGNKIFYKLKNQKYIVIPLKKFNLKISKYVTIDDQR